MNLNINAFEQYVHEVHFGQTSDGGEPYVEHVLRVGKNAKAIALSLPDGMLSTYEVDQIYCVGLLHDVLEDTAKNEAERKERRREIIALGATPSMIDDLNGLTRCDPKPVYMDWIRSIAGGSLGRLIVKIADNNDNRSKERIDNLPEEKRSILKRYERAYAIMAPELDRRIQEFLSRNVASGPAF